MSKAPELTAEQWVQLLQDAARDGETPILMTQREYNTMVRKVVRRALTVPLVVISILAILGGAVWLSGLTGC